MRLSCNGRTTQAQLTDMRASCCSGSSFLVLRQPQPNRLKIEKIFFLKNQEI